MYQKVVLSDGTSSLEEFIGKMVGNLKRHPIELLWDGLPEGWTNMNTTTRQNLDIFVSEEPFSCFVQEASFHEAPVRGLQIKGARATDGKPFSGWVEWLTGRGRIGWTISALAKNHHLLHTDQMPSTWESIVSTSLLGAKPLQSFTSKEMIVLRFPKEQTHQGRLLPHGIKDRNLRIFPHTVNTVSCPSGQYYIVGSTEDLQEVVVDLTTQELWVI